MGKERYRALFAGFYIFGVFLSASSAYIWGKIKIGSFLCLKTFLCFVSPVSLQGTVNLKSSKIRKYCKFLRDTKDRIFCKPEKYTVRFQVVIFPFVWGTLYIYIYTHIYTPVFMSLMLSQLAYESCFLFLCSCVHVFSGNLMSQSATRYPKTVHKVRWTWLIWK